MANFAEGWIEFVRVRRRIIEVHFDGGDLSSDGELTLLRRLDQRIGLSLVAAAAPSRAMLKSGV